MIDLRATIPPPQVERAESPFGGYRTVYEWRSGKCGASVAIDAQGEPVYSVALTAGRSITGTGINEAFWLAMAEAGIHPSTEGGLRWLAEHAPRALESVLALEMTFGLKSVAAEVAGWIADQEAVERILLPLLGHLEPVVREGAVYGLSCREPMSARARLALEVLAATETSRGVREAALEALAP